MSRYFRRAAPCLPRPPTVAKIAPVETSALVSTGTALLAGLCFGYCAQRGGFCLTRALSNWALMGDTAIMRAYVLALLVAIVGVHVLELGLVDYGKFQRGGGDTKGWGLDIPLLLGFPIGSN